MTEETVPYIKVQILMKAYFILMTGYTILCQAPQNFAWY